MVLLQVPGLSCDSPCRAETETAVSAVSVKLQQGEAASRSAQSLVVKHNILASARHPHTHLGQRPPQHYQNYKLRGDCVLFWTKKVKLAQYSCFSLTDVTRERLNICLLLHSDESKVTTNYTHITKRDHVVSRSWTIWAWLLRNRQSLQFTWWRNWESSQWDSCQEYIGHFSSTERSYQQQHDGNIQRKSLFVYFPPIVL